MALTEEDKWTWKQLGVEPGSYVFSKHGQVSPLKPDIFHRYREKKKVLNIGNPASH